VHPSLEVKVYNIRGLNPAVIWCLEAQAHRIWGFEPS